MINFLCPSCNGSMFLEEEKTLEVYTRELGYKVLTGGEIDSTTLQEYAIYKCSECGLIKKFNLKEVEFQIRRALAIQALTLRAVKVMSELPQEARDYDGGLFYCGKCAGVINKEERDGWCLESIAKYCSIYKGLKL